MITKQIWLQQSRVSWCPLSHLKLQPCSLCCPFILCYFFSSVVYCPGCTWCALKYPGGNVLTLPANMQSFFSALHVMYWALTPYSPAVDLISCFIYAKAPSDMLHQNLKYTHCSKSYFYEQNDINSLLCGEKNL